jgi:hypothetical protein
VPDKEKIPKGETESEYRRRTDNTMVKIKSTKGQIKYFNIKWQCQICLVLGSKRYR